MTKLKFINFMNKFNIRTLIKNLSFTTYASFSLLLGAFIFKSRYAITTNQSIAQPAGVCVCLVNTSQPFAMMSMNFRTVKPVVDSFQGNTSIAEAGGEVMSKHSNEIVHYVAANVHLRHVNRRSNALAIFRDDRVVQVAKTGATLLELSSNANEDIQSFQKSRWRGFTFDYDYTYDLKSGQQNQPVKATETHSYAFSSRYKIQRGDGTLNAFAPTQQLGRNTTLDFQAEKIEHAISRLTSNSSVSSEQNVSESGGSVGSESGGSVGSELDGSVRSESGPGSEGSRVDVVQTGDTGDIQLEPQQEAELKKKIVCGLGDMLVNAHNTSLLEKLKESPQFEAAAKLVHQEIGEELNQRLNAAPFTPENAERVFQEFPGLFHDPENNQVAVYVEEPSILTKLSKYVKLLEVGEEISVPGYPVNFTGEKEDSPATEFSTFGDTVVYNKKGGFREAIKKKVKALSNQSITFSKALSLEDVLAEVPEEERLDTLTRVVTNIINVPELKEEILTHFVGNQEVPIDPITYDDKQQADHFLRVYLRTALGQRLLNTNSKNDKALSVELPPKLHNLKEQFTDFREPRDFSYNEGLTEFFSHILASIHEGFDKTTDKERNYVPVEKYQNAYTECFSAKVLEMNEKFPDYNEREKLMIYHANVARLADQQDLEKFQENHLNTYALKKSVLGTDVEKNINVFADLLIRNAAQRAGFIKTLAEFCSPECAEVINSIQKEHQHSVIANFVPIEAMTHPLSEQQKEALFNPPSLTKVLFAGCYNEESGEVSLSPEEIDQVLYAEARNMGLTNIGSGLPSPGPSLNYQTQETQINQGVEDKKTAEKALKTNTNLLTELLDNTDLIRDCRKPPFEFASQNAQDLHVFLLEQGIPKVLADKVVIEGQIDTIEALQAAINDGSIQSINALGEGKAAKLKEIVHMHPQANVSSTSEINVDVSPIPETSSDSSNTVASQSARKPSVRRVKASRSTSDLVSLQKTKTTLSRSSSMPFESNLLTSSNQVKLLEEGPSSSRQ